MSPIVLGEEGASTGETIILDPAAVATGRVQLDITPWVDAQAGVDWGDAGIEAYVAEACRGQIPVDFRFPNRTVTIPLKLRAIGATTFETVRRSLQAKAALFQREGGWLSRETTEGTWYADVVNATLRLGGDYLQAFRNVDINAVLTLECIPDFYGAEVTLDAIVETAEAEIVEVLQEDAADVVIRGDYPGRVRIAVTDFEGVDQAGAIWAFRVRHYSAAATAALTYEAEDLTAKGGATVAAVAGASGGDAVQRTSLLTDWSAVLSTDLAGTGPLTHTGSYRAWGRMRSTSTTPPRVRFVWGVGELGNPTVNRSLLIPGSNDWYLVDLGEIRLDAPPAGTHRWRGEVHAIGAAGGENVAIDKLWFQPIDEFAGRLRAPTTDDSLQAVRVVAALDEFTSTTSGNALNGRMPSMGAAWATSGAAGDFLFIDAADAGGNTTEAVSRSSSSASFRYGVLGSAMTDMQVQAELGFESRPVSGSLGVHGVLARWVDANNHLRFYMDSVAPPLLDQEVWVLEKVVGGVSTVLANGSTNGIVLPASTPRLTVRSSGYVIAEVLNSAGAVELALAASDGDLAASGALDDGLPGIVDAGDGTNTFERWYDDVVVYELPPSPAVVHASRTSELRTEGMFVEDVDGGDFGKVAHVTGDLPRLPPSGLEERSVEVFVKASRGDLETVPDFAIDDIGVQVFYRPSWLFVPGT